MKIEIENFRSCGSGQIDASKFVIVGGSNAAGKSSIFMGIGAALTGKLPYNMPKTQARELLKDGEVSGSVVIDSEDGIITLSLPDAERDITGVPAEASAFATGQKSFIGLTDKERAAELLKYMKAEPTLLDLRAAVIPEVGDDTLDKVWQRIEAQGWDTVATDAENKNKIIKGRWQQITGEAFKPAKGGGWMPKAWEHDLEGKSEETLAGDLASERQYLEAALKVEAISAEKLSELQESAAGIDTYLAEMEAAKAADQAALTEVAEANKAVNALAQKSSPCPHCNEPIIVSGGKLSKPTGELPTNEQCKEAAARLNAALEASHAAEAVRMTAELKVVSSRQSAEKLKNFALSDAKQPSARDVDMQRERVKRAEKRLEAFTQKQQADQQFASFTANQSILEALAADGVRKQKLNKMIKKFNSENLAPLCAVAGWQAVELNNDLNVTCGKRRYLLAAESEQMRARVILQAAFALLDGSQILLIDRIDMLVKQHRQGLMKLLAHVGVPAVLFCTANDASELPDLARAKLGHTYWLEDGILKVVGQPAAAVA